MPYYLPENYTPRLDNEAFDDTPHTDLWQNDVYELAHQLAMAYGLGTVLDIGCGSGYKLMKFFRQFHTVGVEIEPTLSWLREKYPDRIWMSPEEVTPEFKLVICSDVIEHVADPDALLESIKRARPKKIVISTPDRFMLNCDQAGPPRNISHVREWSFSEFDRYLTDHFHIVSHYICNEEQCTQVAVCELRP